MKEDELGFVLLGEGLGELGGVELEEGVGVFGGALFQFLLDSLDHFVDLEVRAVGACVLVDDVKVQLKDDVTNDSVLTGAVLFVDRLKLQEIGLIELGDGDCQESVGVVGIPFGFVAGEKRFPDRSGERVPSGGDFFGDIVCIFVCRGWQQDFPVGGVCGKAKVEVRIEQMCVGDSVFGGFVCGQVF